MNALTFGKDGKQIEDNSIPNSQTPQELLRSEKAEGLLIKQIPSRVAETFEYEFDWNDCSIVSHNLSLILNLCSPTGKVRQKAIEEEKERHIRKFQCGFDGHSRYLINKSESGHWAKSACDKNKINSTITKYDELVSVVQQYGPNAFLSATSKIPDNLTPAELLESINPESSLIKLKTVKNHGRASFRYDDDWNVCNATSHNLAVMLKNAGSTALIEKQWFLKEEKGN